MSRLCGLTVLVFAMALASQAGGRAGDKSDPKKKPPPAKGVIEKQVEVGAWVNKILARFDTDKDGKVSRAEAWGTVAKNFDQFDRNKDGFLDRTELRLMVQRMRANQKRPTLIGGDLLRYIGILSLDFDAYDRNADGYLTRAEARGSPLEEFFDQIDTNRDGRISRQEFEQFLERLAPKKP